MSRKRIRSRSTSRIVTSAPRPVAIRAALMPAAPPPRTTTRPGKTPGTHRGMVLEQRGAGLGVFLIPIAGARPSRPFDKHGMPALNQLIRRGGEQGHAVFLLLNFLGKADDHSSRRDGQ